jgi:pimeloyl-ACP methyl ester carboxylesterase
MTGWRALVSLAAVLALLGCGTRGAQPSPAAAPGQPTQSAQPRPPGGQPAAPAPKSDERGAILKKEPKGSASQEEATAIAARFLAGASPLPAKHAVDWHRLEYQSTDREEKPLKVVAQLFVPKVENAASLPVYVFGPGTTGLNDQCAPSAEQPNSRSWGDFQSHLITYASQGLVAVMPDYEGFNDGPRLHHYYVGEQQARVMLDSARAALRFFDEAPLGGAKKQNPIFVSGYSHGGYVALAARDLAQKYAPELQVKGAIGYGPRSEVSTLLKEMPSLGPYVLFSYASYYGGEKVPLEKIVLPRWLPTLERDVTGKCIDEVVGYYGDDPAAIFTPEFVSALRQGTLAQQFPTIKELFDQNRAGLKGKEMPVLVLHGTKDTVVEPATLQAYMKELCGSGGKGQYVLYPDVPHTLIRQIGYADALKWMESVAKGQLPKNDCA